MLPMCCEFDLRLPLSIIHLRDVSWQVQCVMRPSFSSPGVRSFHKFKFDLALCAYVRLVSFCNYGKKDRVTGLRLTKFWENLACGPCLLVYTALRLRTIGIPSLDWAVFPTTTKTSQGGELDTDLLQVIWKKRPSDDGRSDL